MADPDEIASELLELIADAESHAGEVLRRRGQRLAGDLERGLEPVETLIDDLDFGDQVDERQVRAARNAIRELRSLTDRLREIESALEGATFDRLRALAVDLKVGAW